MILGIGVDIIDIERFKEWHTYPHKHLLRIFSQNEIDYCLSVPTKTAERFAVRWAAREALYKAWVNATGKKVPFLTLCKKAAVVYKENVPLLIVDSDFFKINNQHNIRFHLSLSHSNTSALAQVIIEIS